MTKFVATLDANRLLIGFVEKEDAAITEDDIVVEAPDLELRAYRWIEKDQSFLPLTRTEKKKLDEKTVMPEQMTAIVKGFKAIRDDGRIVLPPETLEWIAWCEKFVKV